MQIVIASDENYVVGVLVLIASAHRHNPQARFTVLTTDWSQASLAKLDALRVRLGIEITAVAIAAERLASLPVSRPHLTRATYARLFIADLLPDADRVIYMDCDMLVTGSLGAAWACDFGQNLVGAVRCPAPTPALAAQINLPLQDYINAGFLVMNLALWRAEGVAQSCLGALIDPNRPGLCDESAINDIARGRVQFLDAGFNLYALDRVWQSPLAHPASIKVIHYFTRPKPWTGPCPFGELWHAQRAQMPELADFTSKPELFRAKLTRWNRIRKAVMGAWRGKPQYKDHRQTQDLIQTFLVPNYLKANSFGDIL
jgi:lipopolysaccharide biosynthesis glycosyltransferase